MDEILVGMAEPFQVTETKEMQEQFMALFGDVNYMHLRDDHVREHGYEYKFVYGMLTISI